MTRSRFPLIDFDLSFLFSRNALSNPGKGKSCENHLLKSNPIDSQPKVQFAFIENSITKAGISLNLNRLLKRLNFCRLEPAEISPKYLSGYIRDLCNDENVLRGCGTVGPSNTTAKEMKASIRPKFQANFFIVLHQLSLLFCNFY